MIWTELVGRSQMIIDIGANIGVYSLLVECNNTSATVIATAPVDINHQVLTTNIQKNNYPIRVEKIAISDSEDIKKMFILEKRVKIPDKC